MTLSGKSYLASAGETFDLIALLIYGDEKYAADILCANPDISDKLILDGGEEVRLPVVELLAAGEYPLTAPWKEG